MINEILKLIDKLLLIYFRKINKNRSDFHEGSMGLTVRRRKRLFFIPNRQSAKILTVLYHYMRNFCNLIGLEQWYFSLIWNTYMWKLQTFCG